MLKRFIISFLFLIFIFVNLFTNICYATAVTVTDENLSEAFEKFVSSEENEENCDISVLNNIINVTVEEESYTIKYDLTNKPTFSFEIPIEKGMSYETFKNQTDKLILPMLGYVAVANIQGVEFEDAITYFMLSYLENALNGSYTSENGYLIVDDLNNSDDVTIEKTDDPKIIYTSEFGDRVIEYVNAMYPETQTISDSKAFNHYVMTIEKKDMTETSGKLVSTLSVNTDADFSVLEGYKDKLEESFLDKDITKENADYSITLKVGQKCKIESSEKITGYVLYGSSIDFDRELAEITATKVGVANGYIYIGDEEKSIYITVEENIENETLDVITLKIDEKTDKTDETVQEEKEEENKIEIKDDSVTSESKLPQAGLNKSILFISVIFISSIILAGIKLKKYIDIK